MTTDSNGGPESFGGLLRALRERASLSQSALARRAKRDPSFVNRLESGQRTADRDVTATLWVALELQPNETDRLLAAAGHIPTLYARVGLEDETLQLVAQVLAAEWLEPSDKAEYRQVVTALSRRWLMSLGVSPSISSDGQASLR